MTLTGADFLVRMSTIAVAFVGWSAIAVTLRRALGYELDVLHMYFVRFFIEGGLAVAAFGLVPPVLALTELETATIWRLSSGAAAVTFSFWFVILFRRRRRASPGSIPLRTVVYFTAGISAAVTLWANTFVLPEPSPGAYTLALVTLLVVGGWVFAQNLELFFSRATDEAVVSDAAALGPADPTPARRDERFAVGQSASTSSPTGGGMSSARPSRPSATQAHDTTGGTAAFRTPVCGWRPQQVHASRT